MCAADWRTAWMQSWWKVVAGEAKSSVMLTVNGRLGVQCRFESRMLAPEAMAGKSRVIASIMVATVSSLGARMSRLNVTVPGTVFVEPGCRLSIPVEASAACAVARRCECRISLEAVRRASARDFRSVVPVWVSRPETVMVSHSARGVGTMLVFVSHALRAYTLTVGLHAGYDADFFVGHL